MVESFKNDGRGPSYNGTKSGAKVFDISFLLPCG